MTMFNITDGKNDISRDKPVSQVKDTLDALVAKQETLDEVLAQLQRIAGST